MATKVYKPKRKISTTESEEIKIPASSVDGLSPVATSGSYDDLSHKPTIPAAANNGTLTIQKNGTNVATFGANQSTNVTANITVPTKASDVNALSLDGGTINKSKTIKMDASTNSDGANLKWGTVNSKNPYIGYASDQVDGTFVVGSLLGTNYASGLAIGGGSGNLLWKGTKVATTSDIPTVNNGTLTIQKNGTNVATFGANQSTNTTANIIVPTKVSQLTNDRGYTTNKGTVTQVKINGTTKSPNSAGLVDLGTISGGGGDSVAYVVDLIGELTGGSAYTVFDDGEKGSFTGIIYCEYNTSAGDFEFQINDQIFSCTPASQGITLRVTIDRMYNGWEYLYYYTIVSNDASIDNSGFFTDTNNTMYISTNMGSSYEQRGVGTIIKKVL